MPDSQPGPLSGDGSGEEEADRRRSEWGLVWEPAIPGYWMNETVGELRSAVHAFLEGGPLSEAQIGLLRSYFRQWIHGCGTSILSIRRIESPEIETLKLAVDGLSTRRALAAWVQMAIRAGVDPL